MCRYVVVALTVVACLAAGTWAQEKAPEEDENKIAVNFQCDTMIPVGKEQMEAESTSSFVVHPVDKSASGYLPGSKVPVKFRKTGHQPFTSFMIQARSPGKKVVLGGWEWDDDYQRVFSCNRNGVSDTIMVSARDKGRAPAEMDEVELTWVAPVNAGTGPVEFVATIVVEDTDANVHKFWLDVKSAEMKELHEGL